ncbi:adenylate/guanylate cyclase domain-containing protein [Methylobacterium sp. CB376]|uniref:adenylate/guanylate cyclase domain-containing protein n=1 Tax=unclassified Methylobacterium TaxID=2615210 RepID=UPI0005BD0CA5|nr:MULTISPECIES: adenylate/guanylate cyclase domain-containing protein [Methylobacterium]WFT79856.1 adenylate/guanylate cyclase domain-containing protein [Methylobacterium nodulans]
MAAVLSADMVDYSRFMGANEEWTLARLRSLRRDLIDPEIKRHGGRVVKSTGDGILTEFTSVVEAVRCAVEIQHGIGTWNGDVPETRRIALRIGINVGELVVERDGDIYGDSVNIAARLEAIAPAGGIALSRAAYEQVRGRLSYPVEEWGDQSLKNIDRPVFVFVIRPEAITQLPSQAEPAEPRAVLPRGRALWLAGALLAAVGCVAVARLLAPARPVAPVPETVAPIGADATLAALEEPAPARRRGPAPRLSIVVLPFTNRDGGEAFDLLAESIASDLTSDLSRIDGSFVIAPSTALAWRDRHADRRDLGRNLRVRYVLHGSLHHVGARVRINARLTDTETGAEVWADRFVSEASSIAETEEEIVAQLARALSIELTEAELRQFERERPSAPDAADLAAQGWSVLNRPLSRESLLRAREAFEQALARDGESVRARVGLARTLALAANFGWSSAASDDLARAERLIDGALAARPNEAMAYCVKGEILRGRRQYEEAIAAHQAAIARNANLAPAYGSMANAVLQLGQADKAYALAERAVRLSPHDPLLSLWAATLCEAAERRTMHAAAITWCSRSLVAPSPQPVLIYLHLASAYAETGRTDEARRSIAQLLALRPGYTIGRWREESRSARPEAVHQGDYLADGLRKAGLPD